MDNPLGITYSNPFDSDLKTITKNWEGFIKIHLRHPQHDELYSSEETEHSQ